MKLYGVYMFDNGKCEGFVREQMNPTGPILAFDDEVAAKQWAALNWGYAENDYEAMRADDWAEVRLLSDA